MILTSSKENFSHCDLKALRRFIIIRLGDYKQHRMRSSGQHKTNPDVFERTTRVYLGVRSVDRFSLFRYLLLKFGYCFINDILALSFTQCMYGYVYLIDLSMLGLFRANKTNP